MYDPYINQDITEMLKERYFQSWMKNTKSLWVYERSDRSIKYGGSEEIPFIISETVGNNKRIMCSLNSEMIQINLL